MGIPTLLRELAPASQDTHLSAWAGHTLGVDAMGWLHRSGFSCALELARYDADASQPHPTGYLKWLRRMLHMARTLGVRLVVVFDGAPLPAKSSTNSARDSLRASHRARADALYAQGQMHAAREWYGRCLSVSATMRRNFQHLLRAESVPFVVAPFEADAQLAFMYRSGQISAAITEDSDLLPFGCDKLLLKLDRDGNARLLSLQAVANGRWDKEQQPVLFRLRRMLRDKRNEDDGSEAAVAAAASSSRTAAASSSPVPPVPSSSSAGAAPPRCAGHLRFLHACVLSGCDYLASLRGIGFRKAVILVDDHRTLEGMLYALKDQRKKLEARQKASSAKAARLELAARQAAMAGSADPLDVPSQEEEEEEAIAQAAAATTSKMSTEEYIVQLFNAILTFKHQLIYDAASDSIRHLNPLPEQLQAIWDRSLQTPMATWQPRMPSPTASSPPPAHVVHVLDSDDEDAPAESKEPSPSPSPSPSPPPPMRTVSAAFPTFRDVTDATAALDAMQASGDLLAPPPMPPSHPLLQLRSLAFLGSPLPPSVSVHEWISGRIDPKTLAPYAHGLQATKWTDEGSNDADGGGAAGTPVQQRKGGWKRGASVSSATVAAASSGSRGLPSFFGRSASASTAVFSTTVTAPSGPLHPFALSFGSSSSSVSSSSGRPASRISAPSLTAAAQMAQDMRELEGLFDDDQPEPEPEAEPEAMRPEQAEAGQSEGGAAGSTRAHGNQTQRRLDDDEPMLESNVFPTPTPTAPGAPFSLATAPAPAPAPASPFRNPFARPLRSVGPVATFADGADTSPSPLPALKPAVAAPPAATTATAASSSASTLMSKLFGAARTKDGPAGANVHGAPSAASSSSSQHAMATAPATPVAPRVAPVATSASPQLALCDLTCASDADGEEAAEERADQAPDTRVLRTPSCGGNNVQQDAPSSSAASMPPLKRKASAPASAPRHMPVLKRKKSAPAAPATTGSLLNFFRKTE